MFNIGQQTAVAGAFKLAGYEGALMVGEVDTEDERGFLLDPDDLGQLRDIDALTQVVGQILGCKVWIVSNVGYPARAVPFE